MREELNMKKALHTALLLAVAFSCLSGCAPDNKSKDNKMPAWLEAKIAGSEIATNGPVVVSRWQYNGAVVYYIPPTVPDGMGCVYSATGELIGCPDGGLTGDGDGTCRDFFSTRGDELVLWRSDK